MMISVFLVTHIKNKNNFICKFYKNKYNLNITKFSDFKSNPTLKQVKKAIKEYSKKHFDIIISLGGGSAIDVAKSIKYYLNDFITPHIAIPTTAGSGSEATKFAAIYDNKKKISIEDDSLLPMYQILIPKLLISLPEFYRKSTLLDSMCQAIESIWSVNVTEISKKYALKTLSLINKNDNYIKYITSNDVVVLKDIMTASNFSGKAINITKTTSAHAMSYILTTKYNIPHGIAVSLCLIEILKWLEKNVSYIKFIKNKKEVMSDLNKIALKFNAKNINDFIKKLETIVFDIYKIERPTCHISDLKKLVDNVNINRLNNNPFILNKNDLFDIYKNILIIK